MLLLLPGSRATADEQYSPVGKRLSERPAELLIKMLERPYQEEWKQPQKVVDALGVKEGEVVADLGAGTGLFTFPLARRVGPAGKTYAVEVREELLDIIRDKAEAEGLRNILLVKATPADPGLPPASCDRILTAGVYYYLADPVAYMARLGRALKPGGLLAVIDLDAGKVDEMMKKRRNDLLVPGQVIEQMKRAGFELRASYDFMAQRFLLIFALAG